MPHKAYALPANPAWRTTAPGAEAANLTNAELALRQSLLSAGGGAKASSLSMGRHVEAAAPGELEGPPDRCGFENLVGKIKLVSTAREALSGYRVLWLLIVDVGRVVCSMFTDLFACG